MAYITPVLGEQLLIQIGNGASPEVFTAPNLINTTRGISFSTSTESDELIDLANQSAPAQTIRRVKSTDVKIDGAGMIHKADVYEWIDWANGGNIKNVKVTDGSWVGTGPFVLTSFQISGERRKSSECQITLEQAGAITWSKAA
jgi:predicted secreted protein